MTVEHEHIYFFVSEEFYLFIQVSYFVLFHSFFFPCLHNKRRKKIRQRIAMIRALVGPFDFKERKKKELKRNATFEGKMQKKKKIVKASKRSPFFSSLRHHLSR